MLSGNDPRSASAAQLSKSSALRGVVSKLQALGASLNREFNGRRDWIIPAILSLVPWVWLLPLGTYLYGQDSLGYINPFGANNSPLLQFNPLFSWSFPIPAEQPNFFIQALNLGLDQFLSAAGLRERVLITIGVAIGTYGTWLLLRRVLVLNGLSADGFRWARTLAAAFYIMNPFTLSLIWWHIEGWCYFYIFLPYLLWFLLGVTYQTKWDVRDLALVVVVGVCLGPGLASGFAVSVTLGVVVFLVAILVRPNACYGGWLGKVGRLATVVVGGTLLVAWTIVPYVLVPHAAFTSSNYVNPANLVSTFGRQSTTSTLWNVVTFSANSWIFNAPGSYGIDRVDTILLVEGSLSFMVVIVGATLIRAWKGLGLLYVLALASIALSAGANPPFGPVDATLLSLHGPFLLLVNAYYFLCEYYALLATVLVLILPVQLASRRGLDRTATKGPMETYQTLTLDSFQPPHGDRQADPSQTPGLRWRASSPTEILTALGVVLVGVTLVASFAPFLGGGVFQSRGSNVDEVSLPSSFGELSSVLHRDGVSPDFFTLVLPMSSQLGVPLLLGPNEGFLDTTDLIASYIPGPVIQSNTGAPAADLMNLLAGCRPCENLTLLFDELHIAWVIWDPYVNQSTYETRAAPSGQAINFSLLRESLNSSFGPAQPAGAFGVYSVDEAVPILTLNRGLNVVQAPSRTDFYRFVNSLDNASIPFQRGIGESVWAPSPPGSIPEVSSIALFPFDGSSLSLPASAVPTAMVLNITDAITSLSDWDQWVHPLENSTLDRLSSPLLESLANGSNISTNMTASGAGYVSPAGAVSHLALDSSFSSQTSIVLNLTLGPSTASHTWFNTVVADAQLSVVVQLFTSSLHGPSSLSVAALWDGRPYAWHNVPASNVYDGNLQNLTIVVEPGSVNATVGESNGNVSATVFLGSLQTEAANPGFNASAAPPGGATLGTYSLEVQSIYPSLNLSALSIFRPLPIADVFAVNGSINPTVVPSVVAEASDGDWSLSTVGPVSPGTYEVVLAAAPSGLWRVQSSGTSAESQNIASDCSVFTLNLTGSYRTLSVVLHFNVYLDYGLYLAIGEVLAVPAVAVALHRRWR